MENGPSPKHPHLASMGPTVDWAEIFFIGQINFTGNLFHNRIILHQFFWNRINLCNKFRRRRLLIKWSLRLLIKWPLRLWRQTSSFDEMVRPSLLDDVVYGWSLKQIKNRVFLEMIKSGDSENEIHIDFFSDFREFGIKICL